MRDQRKLWVECAAAVLIACAVLSVRYGLDPLLGSMQPFAPGIAAIALTVWFIGWRAAALAALIIYLGANFFFVEPRGAGSFRGASHFIGLLTYAIASGLIIWFGHLARTAILRARDISAQKDAFVAMVAHELRGPIGAATNAIKLVQSAEATPALKEAALSIATRQLRTMEVVIRDLLDLRRIGRQQLALDKAPFDLRECIDEVVAAVKALSPNKRQTIRVDAPSTVPMRADKGRVVQILFNLIENASKYASESATIEVRARNGEWITIEVADDGAGVPAELLPHVFDMERPPGTPPSRSGGLGLGLPLSKQLAELHGGEIAAGRCARLGGACITVRLPV